jgi:hypothetical protein
MPRWSAAPARTRFRGPTFRQVDPVWPPLFHDAGTSSPGQASGRWHRRGEGFAQYLALVPYGAWAECSRYFGLRSETDAQETRRNLWMVFVDSPAIADLSSFDKWDACGLDPAIGVDSDHTASQALADDLRGAGFRGVLSPSASLPDALNLTLFGQRLESVVRRDIDSWDNPDPKVWLPVLPVVQEAGVPVDLCTDTVWINHPHPSYRAWMKSKGKRVRSAHP